MGTNFNSIRKLHGTRTGYNRPIIKDAGKRKKQSVNFYSLNAFVIINTLTN